MIRRARPDDAPAIAAIAVAAYRIYVTRIGREPAPMVADFPAQIAAGEVHVLEAERGLQGFIVLRAAADHLFVENVAVRPARQGKGDGRRLMAFAEATARRLDLPAIRLYTNVKMTENLPFYERLGFAEVERRREDGFDRVYFRRSLA